MHAKYEQSERQVLGREEFCLDKDPSSPAAQISMATGMFSLIICQAECEVYLLIAVLTDTCTTNTYLRHSIFY